MWFWRHDAGWWEKFPKERRKGHGQSLSFKYRPSRIFIEPYCWMGVAGGVHGDGGPFEKSFWKKKISEATEYLSEVTNKSSAYLPFISPSFSPCLHQCLPFSLSLPSQLCSYEDAKLARRFNCTLLHFNKQSSEVRGLPNGFGWFSDVTTHHIKWIEF